MTSNFPTRKINIKNYGVIFASVQKNIGAAGICLVIVNKSIIKNNPNISAIASYKTMVENNSMYNTIPTFSVFIVKEYAKFLIDTGGMDVWE